MPLISECGAGYKQEIGTVCWAYILEYFSQYRRAVFVLWTVFLAQKQVSDPLKKGVQNLTGTNSCCTVHLLEGPSWTCWNRQEEFYDFGSQECLCLVSILEWFIKAVLIVLYIYRPACCEELSVLGTYAVDQNATVNELMLSLLYRSDYRWTNR